MKKNILIEFKDSIFNLESYAHYHKQSLKRTFIYLLFVSIFIGSFSLMKPIQDFNNLISVVEQAHQENIPTIKIDKGILTLQNEKQEYKLIKNDSLLLVNTENPVDNDDLVGYRNGIVISNNRFYVKASYLTRGFIVPEDANGEINSELLSYFIPALKSMKYLIIPIGVILVFLTGLVSIAVVAFFANLILNRVQLKYSDIYKMTTHAVTLPTILKAVESLLGKPIPFSSAIFYAISLLYINYGIMTLAKKS